MEHTSGWLSLGPNPEVNTLPYPQTNWNSPTHMDTMENAKQLKALLCIHDEAISKIQHLGRKSLIHVFLKEYRT